MPQFLERKMATGTAQIEIVSAMSGVPSALNSMSLAPVGQATWIPVGSCGACCMSLAPEDQVCRAFRSCICSHTSLVVWSSQVRGIYTKAIGTDCKSSSVCPENQCAVKTFTNPPVLQKSKVINLWLQDLKCYLPRCHHKGNQCLALFEKSHFQTRLPSPKHLSNLSPTPTWK